MTRQTFWGTCAPTAVPRHASVSRGAHALVFCVAFFIFSQLPVCVALAAHAPETEKRSVEQRPVDSFTIVQRGDHYTVHIAYPSIGNTVADAELAIWARAQATTFIRGVEDLPKDTVLPYTLKIGYETILCSPRVTSVLFKSVITMGAAPAEHGLTTFVYDNSNGRRLTLSSIFSRQEGLLDFLAEYARTALAAELGPGVPRENITQGTMPDAANFDLFSLTPAGLLLHFPPAQVAPANEGYLQVLVPLDTLTQFSPYMPFWGKQLPS